MENTLGKMSLCIFVDCEFFFTNLSEIHLHEKKWVGWHGYGCHALLEMAISEPNQGLCANICNTIIYIHYAPLMMSQKESPRNHPWVIPKKVACLVWVPDSRLIVNDGWFLLLLLLLIRAEILLIGRRKWWVIPTTRNHPSFSSPNQ